MPLDTGIPTLPGDPIRRPSVCLPQLGDKNGLRGGEGVGKVRTGRRPRSPRGAGNSAGTDGKFTVGSPSVQGQDAKPTHPGGGEVQNPTLTSGQMRPLGSPGPAGLAVPSTVSGALNSEPKPFIRRETPGTWPLVIRRPDRELHQASA